MNENNKVVLITGSSRGIGKAIALKFAENNYKIVINCSNNIDTLNETLEEIKKINKNVIAFKTDVSDYKQTEKMFFQINNIFGDVDILINNAGISYVGLFSEMRPEQWKNIMGINVDGVYNCTHNAISSMIKKKSGIIINISSVWGNVGASCEAVYSASKGAVNLFTKALAKELGPCNIRINSIACGVVDTQMNNFLDCDEKKDLIENIPLMRFADTKEVAELALFLSSDNASYLTGQIITLDGAFS